MWPVAFVQQKYLHLIATVVGKLWKALSRTFYNHQLFKAVDMQKKHRFEGEVDL